MLPTSWRSHPGTLPVLVAVAGGAVALAVAGPISALDLALPLLWAGGWLLLLTLATFGAGELLLPLRDDEDLLEQLTLALAAGAGVLIAVAGLLGACHLFHGPLLIAVLALAACRGGLRASRITWPRPPPIASPAFAILMAIVGLVSLLAATAPSPFYDQWNYHLAMPFHWLAQHHLVVFPRQVYTFLPANASLLFAYGLAGPGPWAAQVTTWWCTVLCGALAASLAKTIAPGRPTASILAAAILVCTPAVSEMATLALADPIVMMFAGAAWISVRRLTARGDVWSQRDAAAVGALVALAFGSKYLAGLTVALPVGAALAIAAFRATRSGTSVRRVGLSLTTCALAGALVFSPWAARNLVETGAPLYPYFAGQNRDADTRAHGVSRLGFDVRHLQAAVTIGAVGTEGHAARVGPVFLWLAPLVLLDVLRRRTSREGLTLVMLTAGTTVGLMGWTLAPPYGRFLAPVLVALSALSAAAWAVQLESSRRLVRGAVSASLFLVLVGGLNPVRMAYVRPQLEVATGVRSADELLARGVSSWSAMKASNRLLPPGAVLLLVAETRSFGFERQVIVEDPFGVPFLVELAERSSSTADLIGLLREHGVTHVLVNRREAERLTGHPDVSQYLRCRDPHSQKVLNGAIDLMQPIWEDGSAQIMVVPTASRPLGDPSSDPLDPPTPRFVGERGGT